LPYTLISYSMNLHSNLPKNLPEELATVLQQGHGVRIERIVSTGHRSPAPLTPPPLHHRLRRGPQMTLVAATGLPS